MVKEKKIMNKKTKKGLFLYNKKIKKLLTKHFVITIMVITSEKTCKNLTI